MDFREQLAVWLKFRGLSQRKLAKQLKLTPGAVSMWVNDGEYKTTPSAKHQTEILEALQLTVAEFWIGPKAKKNAKAKRARAVA